jgi:hypothetical protein
VRKQTVCRDNFQTRLRKRCGFSSNRFVIRLDDVLRGAAKIAAPGKMFPVVAAKNLRWVPRVYPALRCGRRQPGRTKWQV